MEKVKMNNIRIEIERQIEADRVHIPAIEKGLMETYFSTYDPHFLETAEGRQDIDNNVFLRYEHCQLHVIPWLKRHTDLTGKSVLEIGCGTGSSTAALAKHVHHVEAYDIDDLSAQGARLRLNVMGLTNTSIHVTDAENIITEIEKNTDNPYDIILLYAVAEHQTIEERHTTLEKCWELLGNNGLLAVVDTPNILHYYDIHTSKLPFLHMLPNRVYARYAHNSPRAPFVQSFSDEKNTSEEQLDIIIARWGRGASYHDFELALGEQYAQHLVADGFEPEILEWFPPTPEEEILRWYFQLKDFEIPLGFSRCVLNVIFKKYENNQEPAGMHQPSYAPPAWRFLGDYLLDANHRIAELEGAVAEYEQRIDKIYSSTTWKLGNLLASIFRKVTSFRGTRQSR